MSRADCNKAWAQGKAVWTASGRADDRATAAAAGPPNVLGLDDAWLLDVTRSSLKATWNERWNCRALTRARQFLANSWSGLIGGPGDAERGMIK